MTDGSPPVIVAYRIETSRTLLRPWDLADAPALRAALDRNDGHLRPWIPWMREQPAPLDHTIRVVREMRGRFDLDMDYRYAIFDREGRVLIGGTGLMPRVGPGALEVGYWIDVASDGKGFATEVASAMVRAAFEIHRVDRVEIHCDPENAPSNRIAEKLAFGREAILRRRATDSEGAVRDSAVWSLFADAYPSSPAARAPIAAFDCLGRRIL